MNFNLCKNYYFYKGSLISSETDKRYTFEIPQGDRFYTYIKEYITNGGVHEQKKEFIDEIIVQDPDKTFFTEQTFHISTTVLATFEPDVVYAYELNINNLKFLESEVSTINYSEENWKLVLYKLLIPYLTDFNLIELE